MQQVAKRQSRGGRFLPVGITVADVEQRLLRACKTLRALPDPDFKFRVIHNAWPDVLQAVEDAYGYTEATMPRFRPKPCDVSDCLVALEWVRVLEKREFKLIWWRSFDISFRHIAIRLHRSDDTARLRYRDALLKAWHEANRQAATRASRASSPQRGRAKVAALAG